MSRFAELTPRNGHTLVVGIVARISGCQNQKELSLEDQIAHGEEIVEQYYDGPVQYLKIATTGKGERLDRPELELIENHLRHKELDLLVCEDLGRLIRGAEATRLCGLAVDHGTRVIAPNDGIDTTSKTWEEEVIRCCGNHVSHNAHTSWRIKQKLRNRFQTLGTATSVPPFGYIKPEGGKTFHDWQKDPAVAGVLENAMKLLRSTLNCSAVADSLNRAGVSPGKYCRRKRWNGSMIRRLFQNPLLKGVARRGRLHTVKHHQTGRRISVPNPKPPLTCEFPHLAYFSATAVDEINQLLQERNDRYRRAKPGQSDPRLETPRKRTRYPGQHASCWYCGRAYVWGGNGMTGHLMCNGSRDWNCWNSISFDGQLAARRVRESVLTALYQVEGFHDQFRQLVKQSLNSCRSPQVELEQLAREEERLAKEKRNLMDVFRQFGAAGGQMLKDELEELSNQMVKLAGRRHELEQTRKARPQLPQSIAELRQMIDSSFQSLTSDSFEFGMLLRKLVPVFQVYLVRLCDGGHLLPRASIRLKLDGLLPNASCNSELSEFLSRELTLDLFEAPQRERIRVEAVRMAEQGIYQREIARRLTMDGSETPEVVKQEEVISQAAVHKALALDLRMKQLGLQTPYVLISSPPDDYHKLRRHRNPKYQFEPMAGYNPPRIE